MLNLNHLRYFTVVVKRRSLRRAAEELNVSQPTLSNSLKKLEDIVGAPLLERSPQGVFPTEYGDALFHFASIAIDAINRGRQEIDLLRRGTKGHVKVGAPGGIIEDVIPEIVADIRQRFPGYTFSVQFGLLHNLLEQIADGQLDFLVSTYWSHSNIAENLKVEPIAELSLSVYGRTGHALLEKKNLVFEDMARAQWILLDSPTMRSLVKVVLGTDENNRINQPVYSNYIPFIHAMMEQMDLISIFPDAYVEPLVRAGKIVAFPYPVIGQKLSVGLIYAAGRAHTPAMMAFSKAALMIVQKRFGLPARDA